MEIVIFSTKDRVPVVRKIRNPGLSRFDCTQEDFGYLQGTNN